MGINVEEAMNQEQTGYPEDDRILAQLEDPIDIEAYSNLMENAHRDGLSAADLIREDPKRTSRPGIKRVCLKDRKRSIRAMVSGVVKSMWDRPVRNPEDTLVHGLFGPTAPPPRMGNKKNSGES